MDKIPLTFHHSDDSWLPSFAENNKATMYIYLIYTNVIDSPKKVIWVSLLK